MVYKDKNDIILSPIQTDKSLSVQYAGHGKIDWNNARSVREKDIEENLGSAEKHRRTVKKMKRFLQWN